MEAYVLASAEGATREGPEGQAASEGDAWSLLFGLGGLGFLVWFIVRLRRWGRRRYIEREAQLQAEIERRKQQLLREQGKDQ